MRIFKPTFKKVIVSIVLIFFLVPFIQLSEPECRAFIKQPRGDSASVKCLDGKRSVFSYILLKTRGTIWSNEHAEIFHWNLYAAPDYIVLVLGSINLYIYFCTMNLLLHNLILKKQERSKY